MVANFQEVVSMCQQKKHVHMLFDSMVLYLLQFVTFLAALFHKYRSWNCKFIFSFVGIFTDSLLKVKKILSGILSSMLILVWIYNND